MHASAMQVKHDIAMTGGLYEPVNSASGFPDSRSVKSLTTHTATVFLKRNLLELHLDVSPLNSG